MPRGFFTGRGVHFYQINLPRNVVEICGREIEGWESVPFSGRGVGRTADKALRNYLIRYFIGRDNAERVVFDLSKIENGGLDRYVVEEK